MGLQEQRQESFASGIWRSTERHLIPQDGAYNLLNYLIDPDGVPIRRGGVLEASDAFGNDGLTFVWSGLLSAGHRTLIAHGSSFGVIAEDGHSVIDIGGAGLARPTLAHSVGGELIFDGGVSYAGSRKPPYATGSVKVTNGSTAVVGSGVTWGTLVDNGMYFTPDGERSYRVQSINNLTSLTLAEPYVGATGTGKAYALAPFSQAAHVAPMYAVVTKRLLWLDHDRVGFSAYGDPRAFDPQDYHQIPGGVDILGGVDRGSGAIVFTTDGVWEISNFDLDEIDPFGNVQQRVDHLDPLILWRREGIAKWNGQLIVPALDGIWLLGAGRLDLPITPLYLEHVHSGYNAGLAAVYRGHYLLPILDSANNLVDLLVSRLDPPVWRGRHVPYVYPWTRLQGLGATARAFAQEVLPGAEPRLLMAGPSPHLLEVRYFNPNANVADDIGTHFDDEIVTRSISTGRGNKNVSRRVGLDYRMWDTQENDNPTLTVAFATEERRDDVVDWGQFSWGQASWSNPDDEEFTDLGTAPEDIEGIDRRTWEIADENGAPRSRRIAFRLRSSGRLAKLMVRGITLWTRESTKAD